MKPPSTTVAARRLVAFVLFLTVLRYPQPSRSFSTSTPSFRYCLASQQQRISSSWPSKSHHPKRRRRYNNNPAATVSSSLALSLLPNNDKVGDGRSVRRTNRNDRITTTTDDDEDHNNNRFLPTTSLSFFVAAALVLFPPAVPLQAAFAFDNGIPDMKNYQTVPKHPEQKPANVGVFSSAKSGGMLASCDGEAPNCFSTTGDENHLLPPWKPKPGTSAQETMKQVLQTIKSYPPGQSRIDKGGFEIVVSRPDYLYVQFESMKHGFIDDVEFALMPGGSELQVRSASRIGFLDLGVNGRRLNYISNQLVENHGWTQSNKPITPDLYPEYFPMMPFSYDDYIRSVLSPKTCPVPANPADCRDPPSGPP